MRKELVLLAGTTETKKTLRSQLKSIFGDVVTIHSYAVEEHLPKTLTDQLIIYSSYLIEEEVKEIVRTNCKVIVANRTINYEYIDQLLSIPEGVNVLYVNDFLETAQDSIRTLKALGMNHVNYFPYHPENEHVPSNIYAAITPGEMELIPAHIHRKMNIGVRLIDIYTIFKIVEHFQLPNSISMEFADRYTKKIIDLTKKLSNESQKASTLNRYLKRVVDGVNDGILAFGKDGKITVFNEELERLLGISSRFAIGKPLNRVLNDLALMRFLSRKDEESNEYFTIKQTPYMVHRFFMKAENTIVATFKNVDETIDMEKARRVALQKKGYVSKYTFASILGKSRLIEETKEIAFRLAKTEAPILIVGENGTGKELFAHAIHQASSRVNNPFVAINFSALPEDLLESELFGYEDGAFTGAKKGGKKGLFEQADGGTIFLDEIGDISVKLQARLLRVLQEMEVRKIGGEKNIPINVRVIAATNKNLPDMIENGQFREDLYHRLKVLYLKIPPLRDRIDDIPFFIQAFLEQFSVNEQQRILDEHLLYFFKKQPWKGNVRELKNVLQYMVAVANGEPLREEHLPTDFSFEEKEKDEVRILNPELEFVLKGIYELYQNNSGISRLKLVEWSRLHSHPLTEQQLRTKMSKLAELGFISIGRGRAGTDITQKTVFYFRNQ
ncbi:sigma-54-dependent Fis family transcriptional regulator [Bacillus sp. AFS040349]|uniref:sigma-54 interaction domain-containing protein n=1 Tax=Bacillus sp. AFS040349 TaxID=2033502 RepID=UPI000BFC2D9F|nr:sigma 54-interacting transcriptional regulator [Bacillus sp. AFS040349]PGT90580.1 transcriptional regulator [Bacillus sp. AFS040349]